MENGQKPDHTKYKQRSGAQNRKRKKAKEETLNEARMQEKLDVLSNWNNMPLQKIYGSSFDYLNQPALTPEEIKKSLELPIYGIEPPKVLYVVQQMLAMQTKGYFLASADFCDAILRDEKIYAFLQVRINGLLGHKTIFKPADNSDMAVEFQEEIEKCFTKMCPLTEIGEMLRWGLLEGNAISQILWNTENTDGKWMPLLSVWHPKYLYYNWALYQYRIVTADQGEVTVEKDDIKWSIFTPYSQHLPWNRALVIPIATLYLIRTWLIQWWARFQERNGQPIIAAITSAEATPQEEKLFIQQLTTLSSNAVVRLPQGVDGNKFDLKFVQPEGDLFEGFKQYLEYIDKSLAQLILGQDKTVGSKPGINIGGSEAGESVRMDLMRFDALTLSEHLREKFFKPYIKFNYGEQYMDLAPYLSWDIEEPQDMNDKATQMFTLSQALTNFAALTIGSEIDYRAIFDEFMFPLLENNKTNPDVPYTNTFLEPPDAEKKEMLSAISACKSYEELLVLLSK